MKTRRFASELVRIGDAIAHADMLAWPFGICDVDIMRMAREFGYIAGFTLSARRVEKSSTLLALPRFPMVDDVTPRILGRLPGEPYPPSVHAPRARSWHPRAAHGHASACAAVAASRSSRRCTRCMLKL
ncbi:hypothetical protein BN2476_560026 [Paraburkholderia piptadeniae]|uniref:Uncharacterized protein n=1 Tax=Paraburkholderia piptadeniae TaxID=1701573 RepID=A0A1N7SIH7_9BURK|nr:hypothetical protein [Paraburkholderia piptadeniae]SIT47187.1 hypothetical protein BN2476_560026 [Paraburkholderia piptadeniae]